MKPTYKMLIALLMFLFIMVLLLMFAKEAIAAYAPQIRPEFK